MVSVNWMASGNLMSIDSSSLKSPRVAVAIAFPSKVEEVLGRLNSTTAQPERLVSMFLRIVG